MHCFNIFRKTLLLLLFFTGTSAALAQTVWTGAVSTDFATAGNWNNGLPSFSKAAIIAAAPFGRWPVVGTTVGSPLPIQAVALSNGAELTITATGTLAALGINVGVGTTVNNAGTFGGINLSIDGTVNTSNTFGASTDALNNAQVVVSNTGIINFNGGLAGFYTGSSSFTNSGTINLNGPGIFAISDNNVRQALFANTGTVNLNHASCTLSVNTGGSSTAFLNTATGQINLNAGLMAIGEPDFSTGGGTNNGTITLAPACACTLAVFSQSGLTGAPANPTFPTLLNPIPAPVHEFINGTTGVIDAQSGVVAFGDIVTFVGHLTNNGTIDISGDAQFGVVGTTFNNATGVINISGDQFSAAGNPNIENTVSFLNQGTINFNYSGIPSTPPPFAFIPPQTNFAFVSAQNEGTINVTTGGGGGVGVSGGLINAASGIINLQTAGSGFGIQGDMQHDGVIVTADSSVLVIGGNGNSSIQGSSTLDVSILGFAKTLDTYNLNFGVPVNVRKLLHFAGGNLRFNTLKNGASAGLSMPMFTLKSDAAQTASLRRQAGTYTTTRGTMTIERHLPGANGGYRYITSPVAGATLADVSGAAFSVNAAFNTSGPSTVPFPNLFYYTEDDRTHPAYSDWMAGWKSPSNTSMAMNFGQGFAYHLGAGNVTLSYNGVPYYSPDGDNISLTNTTGGGNKGDEAMNLIANPFVALLDWDAAVGAHDNTSHVDNSYYAWRASGVYAGTYGSYNRGSGIGTGGVSRLIPQSQGFVVLSLPGASRLKLDTTMLVYSDVYDSPNYYKGAQTDNQNLVRLVMKGSNNWDEIVVYSRDGANDARDSYDAIKILGSTPGISNLYSVGPNGEKLEIDGRSPQLQTTRTIPLGIVFETGKSYSLEASQLSNFGTGSKVYLHDKRLNVVQDLASQPVYNFSAQAGDQNRFALNFYEPAKTTTIDPAKDAGFKAYAANGALVLNFSSLETARGIIRVSNTLGQTLLEINNSGATELVKQISNFEADNQVLIVSVINGGVQSQKVSWSR